ncbi:MAG TPA: PLP-dependent aminotransferase family protein [Cellulomonas sp.]
MSPSLVADRRIGGARLAALLGSWQRPGPAYPALADAVRRAILAGTLPLATRLPGERELAVSTGVSRTTTTAAYRVLREEGYLVSRQGSGTVTTLPRHDDAGRPRVPGASTGPASGTHPTGARRTESSARPGGRARDGSTGGGGTALGGGAAGGGGTGRGAGSTVRRSPVTDGGVVDLSVAAPAAPPDLDEACRRAFDALRGAGIGHGYAPLGLDVLRAAVADRYTARGVPTTPEEVLITTGAQHAISLLIGAHAGPGDRVVVEQPTYPHAIDAVRAAGARPVPVPTGPDGTTDLDLLASTVRQVAPRLVYLIPDHRNPTGTSLDAEARARARDLSLRTGTVIAGDEVLTELTLEGAPPEPWAGDGTGPRVVSIGSMSKSHWGGLRVGWVRGSRDLVTRLALARRSADLGTAVLDQLVATELLAQGDVPVEARRAELRSGRDLLVGLLRDRLPQWTFAVPRGGQSLWVDLGAPVSSALSALALAHGVRVAPGPAFGVDGAMEDRLRLPYTAPEEALVRAVDGLALAWAALGSPGGGRGGPGADGGAVLRPGDFGTVV